MYQDEYPVWEWIGKHMFGKLLPITLLVGVLGGTLLNGQATAALTHSLWLSGAVAALYAVAGVLTLWQQRITETWLSRRLGTNHGDFFLLFSV